MQKFTTLTATAAALPLINIDTDMIIPKQFLKTIKRTGLGENLFYEMRFDQNGKRIDDFVLNKPAFSKAEILVARDNFGCGSSREHAPWSLLDFGIRCVIAPSFADIFHNNCFKNGILPIILPHDQVEDLLTLASVEGNNLTVDLPKQEVRPNEKKGGNEVYRFEIDSFKKNCLLEGLDDIGLTLQHEQKISAFEEANRKSVPWLYKPLTN